MRRNARNFLATLAVATLGAPIALAYPQSVYFLDVPVVDSPDDPADLTGVRCLDLVVQMEPGDRVQAAGLEFGIYSTGLNDWTLWHHPFGADAVFDESVLKLAPDLLYDTALAMGDRAGQIGVFYLNTSDPNDMYALWSANPPAGPALGPGSGAFGQFIRPNSVWLGRFSVVTDVPHPSPWACQHGFYGDLNLAWENAAGEEFNSTLQLSNCLSGDFKPPGPFSLTSPIDESTILNPRVATLSWSEAALPEDYLSITYRVRVTSDPRHWYEVFRADDVVETSLAPPDGVLEPCTTYYWDAHAFSETSWRAAGNWHEGAFTTTLREDINADGVVDAADLGQLIKDFGAPEPEADLNADGEVDTADLGLLIGAFGNTCADPGR